MALGETKFISNEQNEFMSVKQLKKIIQSIPDNVIIVTEGRWGEMLQPDIAKLEEIPGFPEKVLVLS